jgi:hydroxymethylglutaryl-CoA reductase
MKMHLTNILNHLGANSTEIEDAQAYFCEKQVSFSAVRIYLEQIRADKSTVEV